MSRSLKSLRGTVKAAVAAPSFPKGLTEPTTAQLPVRETIYMVITRNFPMLPSGQLDTLVGITMVNGTPLLSLDDRPFIYEILSMVSKLGIEVTLNYLRSKQWTTREEALFMSPLLAANREKSMNDADVIRNKIVVLKVRKPVVNVDQRELYQLRNRLGRQTNL